MDFVKIVDEEKRQILKELGDNPTEIDIKYVGYIRKIPVKQIEQWYEEKKAVDISIDIQLSECEIIGSRKPKVLKSIKIKTESTHPSSFFPQNNDQNKIKETTIQNNQIEQKAFQTQPILIPQQISKSCIQAPKSNCLISQEISSRNHQIVNDNQKNTQQQNTQEECLLNKVSDKINSQNIISQNIEQEDKLNQCQKSNENLNQSVNKVNELASQFNNKYIRQGSQQENQPELDSLKEASKLSLESIKKKIQIEQNKKQDNILQNTQILPPSINGEAVNLNQSQLIEKNIQVSKHNQQKVFKKQQKRSQSQFISSVFDQNNRIQNNEGSINSHQKNNLNVSSQGLDEIMKSKGLEFQPISLSNSNNSLEKNINSNQSKKIQQSPIQVQTQKNNQPNQQQPIITNFQQALPLNNQNYQSQPYYPFYSNEQCKTIQHFVPDFNTIHSMNQQMVMMNNYIVYQGQMQSVLLQKLEQIINLIKDQQKKS